MSAWYLFRISASAYAVSIGLVTPVQSLKLTDAGGSYEDGAAASQAMDRWRKYNVFLSKPESPQQEKKEVKEHEKLDTKWLIISLWVVILIGWSMSFFMSASSEHHGFGIVVLLGLMAFIIAASLGINIISSNLLAISIGLVSLLIFLHCFYFMIFVEAPEQI